MRNVRRRELKCERVDVTYVSKGSEEDTAVMNYDGCRKLSRQDVRLKYGKRNEHADGADDVERGFDDVAHSTCMVTGKRSDVIHGRMGVMTCADDDGCVEEHGDGKEGKEDETTIVEVRMGKEGNGMAGKAIYVGKYVHGVKEEECVVEDLVVAEEIVKKVLVSDGQKKKEHGQKGEEKTEVKSHAVSEEMNTYGRQQRRVEN